MFDRLTKGVVVPLVLRLGLAAIFIYHGYHKVADDGNQWGAAWMQKAEKPLPPAMQMAVAYGEAACGLGLAVGLLTRLAAIGVLVIMAGAIYTTTGVNGFDNLKHGYEYNFAIIVMCVAVILLGGGTLALDRFFRFRVRP